MILILLLLLAIILVLIGINTNIIVKNLFKVVYKHKEEPILLVLICLFMITLNIVAYKIITFEINFRDLIMMLIGGILVGLLTSIFLYIGQNNKKE